MVSKSFDIRNGSVVGAAAVDATTGNITSTETNEAAKEVYLGILQQRNIINREIT